MTEQIVWTDPPGGLRAGAGSWPERLATVRERPGEWARFGPFGGASIGTHARRIASSVPGQYEIAGRKIDGEYFVYVRALPEADA